MNEQLTQMLKELHLPVFGDYYSDFARIASDNELSYEEYLCELATRECEYRRENKIERLIRNSRLPLEKTLQTFELDRLSIKIRRQIKILCEGDFVRRRENILAFGKPGSGKTHLLCSICRELINQGMKVYFTTCDLMVQELLRAKEELLLDKLLKKLGKFEVLMIDDFGYVKQNREEMEVLFTLLAHRYERGSVLITSNLPFGKWDCIFKDPMTTAAAIDRLVHHSVILELNIPSYRAEQAQRRKIEQEKEL